MSIIENATRLQTILIVRNDGTTGWANTSYCLQKGELGIEYLDNGNIIVRAGINGTKPWAECPQVEGVFENDIILTHNFGRHTIPAAGFVDAGGSGMTTSQWILDALSEIKIPNITQPSIAFSAAPSGNGEIGSYITNLNWTATYTDGQYEFGSTADNTSNTRKNTGVTISNYEWSITNSITTETQNNGTEKTTQNASVSGNKPLKQTETGSFALGDSKIQVTQESSKTYATVTATYRRNENNTRTPVNNVGQAYATGAIKAITDPVTMTAANVNASSYRKPFWRCSTETINLDALKVTSTVTSEQLESLGITAEQIEGKTDAEIVSICKRAASDIIRNLGNSGTSNGGFPITDNATKKYFNVPENSTQVLFCCKAGTYKSVVANDANANHATVTFTLVPNGVKVEGANNFNAVDYDIWHVTWPGPIKSAKALYFTWSTT